MSSEGGLGCAEVASAPTPGVMVPRAQPFDASHYDVAHPRPFLCDLLVAPTEMSEVVDHVPNTRYVAWLDRAAELHSDAAGWTRQRLLDAGRMWFVARHEIDYLAEVRAGERLVIATHVRDVRRVRSWRDTTIIRPADEAVVCRASTLWVLVDLATRRPMQIPRDMMQSFEPLAWQEGT